MAHLDVYVENQSHFLKAAGYKLRQMLGGLRRANLSFRVLDQFCSKDVGQRAFLHVDLTELPKPLKEIDRHYPRCVNGHAITISRLLYTKARLLQGDDYVGPVIAKTALNSRGLPEFRFNMSRNGASIPVHMLKQIGIRAYIAQVCPMYRVYPSISDVPDRVWTDPRLIVERFLPRCLDLPVVKHRFDFFYDVELNMRSTYGSLLCEPETVISTETVAMVPAEVAAVRRTLNLDFGAIDYFVIKDEVFVIDANKTVTTTPSWMARFPAVARHMELATERLIDFACGA
jgi:hypothetical protein